MDIFSIGVGVVMGAALGWFIRVLADHNKPQAAAVAAAVQSATAAVKKEL